jgi:hypothetical protein
MALQTRPHMPQLALLVLRLTSHPLVALMSQSPEPGMHARPQRPMMQVALAPVALGHTVPHAPQLRTSEAVFDSQPLRPLPSQLPKPVLHAMPHTLPAQVAVALAAAAQRKPHMPQFVGFAASSASQPLVKLLSQLPKPGLQANAQALLVHVPVAFARPAQLVPQAPQFVALVRRSVSQPLVPMRSQSPEPAEQVRVHTPATQLAVLPVGAVHTVPQAPQFITLLLVRVSQPLAALPSQLAKPALHTSEQVPMAHPDWPLATAPVGHTVPQAPQWETLVPVLVSQPLAALPSQSPKPAAHMAPRRTGPSCRPPSRWRGRSASCTRRSGWCRC